MLLNEIILGQSNQDEIDRLNSQIDSLNSQVNYLNGRVSSLNSTISSLNSQLSAANQKANLYSAVADDAGSNTITINTPYSLSNYNEIEVFSVGLNSGTWKAAGTKIIYFKLKPKLSSSQCANLPETFLVHYLSSSPHLAYSVNDRSSFFGYLDCSVSSNLLTLTRNSVPGTFNGNNLFLGKYVARINS